MGLERSARIFKSCFCDLHEVCPYPGPLLCEEVMLKTILDLCQGKGEHGRGALENAWNVVLPPYAAHLDTYDNSSAGEAFGGIKGRATLESFV